MKQYEAVLETLRRLGGVATLGRLYAETFKIRDCQWNTKTPFASIRRIVQQTEGIYKIRPGLYGLEKMRQEIISRGIVSEGCVASSIVSERFTHSYYQGLLLEMGNMRQWATFVPQQDKNKLFYDGRKLGQLSTLRELPPFSYPQTVKRSSTIDVVWMNERRMPHSFFEVEHTTDIQNSLLKFDDLVDFSARMIIVADQKREEEFRAKLAYHGFDELRQHKCVSFLSYDSLIRQYERAVENSKEIITL